MVFDFFLEQDSFECGKELIPWTPNDWKENPKFLNNIIDPAFKRFAFELNGLWKVLGRKMRDEITVSQTSIRAISSLLISTNYLMYITGAQRIVFYYLCKEWCYCSWWSIPRILLLGLILDYTRFTSF